MFLGLFKSKEVCMHCGVNKTRRKDGDGNPICSACELEQRMKREEVRCCPIDGEQMKKEPILDADVIIDRCPKCQGVWLDHEELRAIREAAGNSQLATGLAVGLAIN